jgi:hypothetical protein
VLSPESFVSTVKEQYAWSMFFMNILL